jgi:predicted ABC-type ATPase
MFKKSSEGFVDKDAIAKKIVNNMHRRDDYMAMRRAVPELDACIFARLLNMPSEFEQDHKYIKSLL